MSCFDCFISLLSIFFAFTLFYDISETFELFNNFIPLIAFYLLLKVLIFQLFGLYLPVTKYTDLDITFKITQSVIVSVGVGILLIYVFASESITESVIVVDGFISIISITASRIMIRYLIKSLQILELDSQQKEYVVIYGAGSAGYQLAQSLEQNPEYKLLAFVDDNPEIQGRSLLGVPIYFPNHIISLYDQKPFGTLIFAIPNLTTSRRREMVEGFKQLPINFKTIPNLKELLSTKASVSEIKNIEMTELLGREEIIPNQNLLKTNITDKAVLVTGAGGSIGSELCRQIVELQPKCLVLFELNEFALYTIDMELREKKVDVPIYPYLGNITDELYFESILKKHHIETVYHAAAYKHVPLVEMNPSIGVYNNVAGTLITARSSLACGVKNYVLISTDKAVRPTNVMGASKRVAELVIQGLAAQDDTKTTFAMVRFGNVLNSSGSVIPRFRKQISEGKSITLTHKEITRYFISIPEAVSLVIQAGAMAKGGEIFLLDMGNPVRIYDLAVKMIELSGMIPEKDIKIDIIGLRPGEKLYEELLIDTNNSSPSQHPQIFSGNEPIINWETLQPNLDNLLSYAKERNSEEVLKQLKILVPEFNNPLII
ncbi:nucleoside-diphosphate sugar epimerase/dehydratase [Geminocystis sp. GBBB08]|uniref:polysaccharide biosynthesis protein n=1 Tax=Geminocystis sp. GBBB08 TaxID=2604140 RepID=UPI0027E283DF|nr:nucleoside-diphosphate sugar epimerase/dehydratase [Geminocystis sp. GBBB08]